MTSNDFEAKLAALRPLFQQRLSGDYLQLTELWEQLVSEATDADRTTLLRCLHTLKGNSGTFGFTDLGEQAAQLEAAIKAGKQRQESTLDCYEKLLVQIQTHMITTDDANRGRP